MIITEEHLHLCGTVLAEQLAASAARDPAVSCRAREPYERAVALGQRLKQRDALRTTCQSEAVALHVNAGVRLTPGRQKARANLVARVLATRMLHRRNCEVERTLRERVV